MATLPSIEDEPADDPLECVALNRLLALGLVLRVAVCAFASPFNSDDHLAVIDWILRQHALPVSNLLQQSYQPSLYYALMLPLRWLSPVATWPLHVASLAISCGTLVGLRRLFDDPLVRGLGATRAFRVAAFALVATLAQFVMFGSFISNDPLTQLLGVLLFAAVLRYARAPSTRGVTMLAVLVALGLLTKGTFLPVGVALAPVVMRTEWPRGGGRRAARVTAAFCCAWLLLGSFKYVDNVVRLGRPIVHNQDLWLDRRASRTIWHGPSTIYDVDVTSLIRHPIVRPAAPTSYPLMLYATFWYAFLGDSSFKGNISGYDLVGRATYATAVVPTLIFAVGCGVAVVALTRLRRSFDARRTALATAALLFASNLAVVVAAGVRYDRWEAFQGRLLFQSIAPIVFLFLAGAARLPRFPILRVAILVACWTTASLGVLYFLVEFALAKHLLEIDPSLARDMLGAISLTP